METRGERGASDDDDAGVRWMRDDDDGAGAACVVRAQYKHASGDVCREGGDDGCE